MAIVRVKVDLWINYEVLKNNSYDAGFDMSGDAKEDCEGLIAQAVDSLLALEKMEISSTMARRCG